VRASTGVDVRKALLAQRRRCGLRLARSARQAAALPEHDAASRTILVGYSNGGMGTRYFARLYPEHFSAAVPIAFNDTIVGPARCPSTQSKAPATSCGCGPSAILRGTLMSARSS
jgi:pimeloyl-ACP methyl ester carboxylesterase